MIIRVENEISEMHVINQIKEKSILYNNSYINDSYAVICIH